MSLDLEETIIQLERAAQGIGHARDRRLARVKSLLESASAVEPETARQKTRFFTEPFLAAQVEEALVGGFVPAGPPGDWCVASVDGSHIDIDRHLPLSCYLINLGGCVLTYGSRPDCALFSRPSLAAGPEGTTLTDPAHSVNQETVTGPLLGLVRTVGELSRLAETVKECPPDLPVLALVDGTLVLWGLAGQGYRPFVRRAILEEGLLPALESLQQLARSRPLSLAAYVSLPRTTEVVNAIRCCLCPHEMGRCREACSNQRSSNSPCDNANDLLDREVFQELLSPGGRSPLYRTNSSVPREYYGEHQVYFYYLHAGDEIARVEVPQWVAEDEKLLALGHSLLVDQCRRGQGYPVAISEAHEQAVINASDRQHFKRMVAETLERQGLPAYTSEKDRSKRTPWL